MNYSEKYKYLRESDKERVSEIGIRALETFAGQDVSALQSQIATLEQQVKHLTARLGNSETLLEEYRSRVLQQTKSQSIDADTLAVILQSKLRIGQSSCDRGREFEGLTDQVLQDAFPDAAVTRTTGKAHAGDFQLFIQDQLVVIESKNYSKPVPKDEVDKFERDVDCCRASIGLMISLEQPIQGKRRVEVERSGNKLLAFLTINSVDMSAVGIIIRALLATQCIFQKSCQTERFVALARSVNEQSQSVIAEVERYSKYNNKHCKALEVVKRELHALGTEMQKQTNNL